MAICVTVIAGTIYSILIPNNKMEKTVKFTISLFFLASIILPFVNGSLDIDIISDIAVPAIGIQADNDEGMIALAEKKIDAELLGILNSNKTFPKKVETNININETNCISISNVVVTLDSTDEKSSKKVEKLIKKEVGKTPKILYE